MDFYKMPPASPSDIASLQKQIEELKRRIESLEDIVLLFPAQK